MTSITVQTPAKINLLLDVKGKREDDYHLISSVFQAVDICDTLTVSRREGQKITLSSSNRFLPCSPKNIAYQAADALLKATNTTCGLHIHIEKHIPSQAGMGGGSSDGAAVLVALNQLLGLGLHPKALCNIGARIGADIPFFLLGGTVLVEGIGEKLTPLHALPPMPLVIAKGKAGVSTPEAYRKIDALKHPRHPDTEAMLQAVDRQNLPALADACGNLFEQAIQLEEVDSIRSIMLQTGASCSVMTGSGSAVFGLCTSQSVAQACCNALHAAAIPYAVTCKTLECGIRILQTED